ncbi:aromatic acid exporter family protein [Bacillus carboniphilus]|uniref:Aromatic acid exporter family protein n=1 Tax=Bacillus carboniphilus TaxID=86663 RepID=A0ABY9JWZ4_9BACI|nr:aromatic acid exporter family protein [Bacillus carboniphilus]WLR42828.1 aromatic acid exporter family protein [Bacillus carboniphilus]
MKWIKGKFFGGRIIKTGIAVFITAWICHYFELPSIFAVITAIVTIEPTATDSFRKGLIRFPASAIGPAYSMTLTYLFGNVPISYGIAAVLTIFTCQKLKLEEGTLVATITAVAMIPITSSGYLASFFLRLMTTTIGLIVSTAINFLILPPDYTPVIMKKMDQLYEKSGEYLDKRVADMMNGRHSTVDPLFEQLTKDIEMTTKLLSYQKVDWKLHRHSKKEMKQYHYIQKRLLNLQQLIFHLGNIQFIHDIECNKENKEIILIASKYISNSLRDHCHAMDKAHIKSIDELDQLFWHHLSNECRDHHEQFHPDRILIYESFLFMTLFNS